MASAARGFLTSSKRGHRIFRKVAGGVCRRAKEQLGPDGLRWTKAAWVGGLRAAMTGLEALAGTADAGLQQGFKEVLTSIAQAHREGLQQQARAPCRGHRAPASQTPARPAVTSQSRAPARGTSGKARKAREELASYLFGDKGELWHFDWASLIKAPDQAFARQTQGLGALWPQGPDFATYKTS
jgi:hypothetical protein